MTDWKDYEREIFQEFRQAYPSAKITRNAKLLGKFSKVEREIDVLIEEQASDFSFRIVVDAKYRGRKLDVSDVEAFIGLTRDVEAHTGVMVALEGYTPAAVNRAYYDDTDILLDVLSLDELKVLQGRAAIPYSGKCGATVLAPFGWVIDATRREHMIASLYQRGLTFEEALHNNEWMYINFWTKKEKQKVNTLEALLEFQKSYILRRSPDAEIRILEGTPGQKVGAKTLIRCLQKKGYRGPEYAGFVDFKDFIFMCVLHTPEEMERKNLRKLRAVLREVFPMKVTRNSTKAIEAAEEKLKESLSDAERASLLSRIGWWYRDMEQFQQGRKSLEASLALVPNDYETVKQLLATVIKLGDKPATLEVMSRLLRLDPHNPTVFTDCFEYSNWADIEIADSDFLALFETLKTDYPHDELVLATCDFFSGNVLSGTNLKAAKERFVSARRRFRKVLPPNHQVFAELRSGLQQISAFLKKPVRGR